MQTKEQEYWEKRLKKLREERQAIKEKLALIKKENKALQKALKFKNNLYQSIPIGIILIQDDAIIDVNEAALDQMGYGADEMIGRDFLSFVHPEEQIDVKNRLKKRQSGKWMTNLYETNIVAKNGGTFCCDVGMSKIKFNGRWGLLLSLTRIEDRKKREKEIIQTRKTEALTLMASGLARNFSPNLDAIATNTRNIREGADKDNKDLMDCLNNIEYAASQLLKTNRQLDCFSRTHTDPLDVTLIDLKKMVRDSVSLTEPIVKNYAEKRGVQINLKTYLRSVSPIEGDPSEIQDVITNAILNAVDAMPEGGDLYLTIEENSGLAHIYIQDSGVGIPDHIKENIFDPCFTTKGNDGIGLGLSQSYAIVKRHLGDIEISSNKDQGTITTIKLPCVSRERGPKRRVPKRKIKNAHILIIEDDDMIRELLSQLLGCKGYKVVTAASALEGLNKMKRKEFHVIIADSKTPGVNGQALIKKIKKINSDIPVVLISEYEARESLSAVNKAASDLIINKPIDMNKLVNQLSDLI